MKVKLNNHDRRLGYITFNAVIVCFLRVNKGINGATSARRDDVK